MRHGLVTLVVLLSLGFGSSACKRQDDSSAPTVGGDCDGKCGKYTHCDDGRCVVDYTTAVCEDMSTDLGEPVESMPPVTTWGACDVDPASLPEEFVPVDDSGIPRYDPNKATVLDMNAGSERLDDTRLMSEMRTIEHALNRCLSVASCYNNGLGSGTISFEFRIVGKTGAVNGVNVSAPEALSVYGIVPCARAAIYEHTFPTFDGQHMVVNYSVELD
ncbi:MAG: hypothetical protein R3A79_02265 [Nannocystaceae bacterium]